MNEEPGVEEWRKGLKFQTPPAPEELELERAHLRELERAGGLRRTIGYLRLLGPGYLQSAMTLGGGTLAASVFAGAAFGYELLWVAPVAMLLGVVVMAAVAHQTLSKGMRPFEAMRRFAGAPFAWAWALGALLSSIVWQFAQYALGAAVLADMGTVLGFEDVPRAATSALLLVWAIGLSMIYGSSKRAVLLYERLLKYMVWVTVLCFGLAVFKTGISDWGALWRGFTAFRIPQDRGEISGLVLVISGFSAAVGVNMLFLYPYSLLSRGWGRDHRRLARFDLLGGMLVPYAIATSLIVIATANTLHVAGDFSGASMSPVQAAAALADLMGPTMGRLVFNTGVLCMALSSISLQMICSGFVCSELFGWPVGSRRYRLATLLPAPGVLGGVLWGKIAVYVAVPTNIVCGLFLPAAYLGFVLLQRNRDYLGEDTPGGFKGKAWLGGMVASTLILVVFFGWFVVTKGPGYLDGLF